MSSSETTKNNELISKNVPNNGRTELRISNNELCVFLMDRTPIVVSFTSRNAPLTASDVFNKVYDGLKFPINGKQLDFNVKYKSLFAIWLTSAHLELQLQSNHKPLNVLMNWDSLLQKYGPTELMENPKLIEKDEPTLDFQRNVFIKKSDEMQCQDIGALRLLYFEAKLNVLDGRYPTNKYEKLAAIQAAIELGLFDKTKHTVEFFRQHLNEYIPNNYINRNGDNNKISGLIRTLSRNSQATRLAQQIASNYEEIKDEMSELTLLRKYMEICWSIPCYGSAYFSAQIERPSKSGLVSIIMNNFDLKVWVALNSEGLHLITKETSELLLSIEYNKLFWEIGWPKEVDNPNCIPCLFIQILDNSNNNSILQIFSRQIKLIESLLNTFIEKSDVSVNQVIISSDDCTDGSYSTNTCSVNHNGSNGSTNSLNTKRLSFATFDKSGRCIDKTGSWVKKMQKAK